MAISGPQEFERFRQTSTGRICTLVVIACVIVSVTVLVLTVVYFVNRKSDDPSLPSRIGSFRPFYNIKADAADIQTMMEKGQRNQFDEICGLLEYKPYLINVIPENQTNALLHLAVIHNNSDAVMKLVNFTSCDVKVQSVPNGDRLFGGKIPEDLAVDGIMKDFLHQCTEDLMAERFGTQPVFFATQTKGDKYNKNGLPLFLVTMSAYKISFFGNYTITPTDSFRHLLELAFARTDTDLKTVENTIIDSLYGYDMDAGRSLRLDTKYEFYRQIVRLYTGIAIHRGLNRVLKAEALFDYASYRPRSEALHFGPYALIFDCVLTYWEELSPYNATTYRGISTNITDQYHVGMTFVYLDFVSSSDRKTVAESFAGLFGTVLVLNNTHESPWQPRGVAKFSIFQGESEYIYPSGAEFLVTDMDGRHIYLELQQPQYTDV